MTCLSTALPPRSALPSQPASEPGSHAQPCTLQHVSCSLSLPQGSTNSKYLLCRGPGPCHGPCLGRGRLLAQLPPRSSRWRSRHGPASCARACCPGASLQQTGNREAGGVLQGEDSSLDQASCSRSSLDAQKKFGSLPVAGEGERGPSPSTHLSARRGCWRGACAARSAGCSARPFCPEAPLTSCLSAKGPTCVCCLQKDRVWV